MSNRIEIKLVNGDIVTVEDYVINNLPDNSYDKKNITIKDIVNDMTIRADFNHGFIRTYTNQVIRFDKIISMTLL